LHGLVDASVEYQGKPTASGIDLLQLRRAEDLAL
jgi:hypothetical protein